MARPHYQIVGVVADTKYRDLRSPAGPIAYFPAAQEPHPEPFLQVVLRAEGGTGAARAKVAAAIAGVNRSIGVQFQAMDEQITQVLLPERLMAALSGFFGALAALIATIGLYGVMSYIVTRRKIEIGIRMALGADSLTVIRMILRESAILVAVGLAVGAGLAIYGSHQASTLLFGLEPGDPTTLVLAIGGLASVAALASYLPAYRAAHLDPTVALREE